MQAHRLTHEGRSQSRVDRLALAALPLGLFMACNGILGIGEPEDPPDETGGRGGNAGAQGENGGESGDGRGGASGSRAGGSSGSGTSAGTTNGGSGRGGSGEDAGNGGVAGEDAGNGGVAGEDAGSGGIGGAGSTGVGGGGVGGIGPVRFTAFSNADVMPAGSHPRGITAAPDGNLYFAMIDTNAIGKITTSGQVSLVATLEARDGSQSGPIGIVAGPEGNLWIAENRSDRIGCVKPETGAVTHFDLPTGRKPYAITVGSDGNIWFTGHRGDSIGRLSPSCDDPALGEFTEFTPSTSNSRPWGIASGDLGRMWFTESNVNKLGWISTDGTGPVTEIELAGESGPSGITVVQGAVWYSESALHMVGRLLPGGQPERFALGGCVDPIGITSDSNGNIWIACDDDVVQLSPEGVVLRRVPTGANSGNFWITLGPDGNVWVTSHGLDRIGRIIP